MKLLLYQGEEQVGPYTEEQVRGMVAAGTISEEALGWHEGLAEWQPLNAILYFETQESAPVPVPSGQGPMQSGNAVKTTAAAAAAAETKVVQTNVMQGGIIGGWVCFVLGAGLMLLSMWSFFFYGPLFVVAFILSVVAMAQRRVVGGVVLLLTTLIVPAVLGLVLFTSRTAKVLDGLRANREDHDSTSSTAKVWDGLIRAEHDPASKCLSNAKQIGTACLIYATDKSGHFPKSLNELFPDYLPDKAIFSSPLAPQMGNIDYDYFGAGASDTDNGDKIVLCGAIRQPTAGVASCG